MKISYLTAGAAGMLCGSCLHDNTLAAALLDQGEEVLLIPTYTPVRTDEKDVSEHRVFFGGIHVYLQQKWAFFRHLPQWFDRWFLPWLDHPALLRQLAGRASSVDPAQLGELTVSMLRGEHGYQHQELQKLAYWLRKDVKPDVLHLSNALMVGMARTLRKECQCPLVCTLSGEDLFLNSLLDPFHTEAIELIQQQVEYVDAWVAMNHYYADSMATTLRIDRQRIHVIPHGLQLASYLSQPIRSHSGQWAEGPVRIGYLARICPEKGIQVLVDACILLAKREDLPPWELQAAGYLGPGDQVFFDQLTHRIASSPLAAHWSYLGELDYQQKIDFYQAIDLFSLPTTYPESKGLSALEAQAAGIPVVLPAHGTFPELLADTQGGLEFRPTDANDLAEKLATLLLNPSQALQAGQSGREAIHARYRAETMAQATSALYRDLIGA